MQPFKFCIVLLLSLVAFATIPSVLAQNYQSILLFNGMTDGSDPESGVLLATDGTIYGTTYGGGGQSDTGTVFTILDTTGALTVLYNFKGGTDGSGPTAPVILDAVGNLYGTTELGGDLSCKLLNMSLGCGTVFQTRQNSPGDRLVPL